eukprot:TRINITY_DN1793_c0_g1_i1.p1 TRINITY_DN1793_c0_g1~~TRINITY_DN1793_c0_g1_i1.p1  ORF type:complete len:202 (-),score=8.73 TRINITY_DN1793_c0_g1_i1:54-659(-)
METNLKVRKRLKILLVVIFLIPILTFSVFIASTSGLLGEGWSWLDFEGNVDNRATLSTEVDGTTVDIGSSDVVCRNTVQGMRYLADHTGSICTRDNWNSTSGCCDHSESDVCIGCNDKFNCCQNYEFCVSCCYMDKSLSKQPLDAIDDKKGNPVYDRIKFTDIFDYCKVRCRTSSSSVIHFNAYRSGLKYCFGDSDGPLKV